MCVYVCVCFKGIWIGVNNVECVDLVLFHAH